MFLPSISSCKQPWYYIIKMIFKLSCTLCQNTLFSITSLHHESGVFYNFFVKSNLPTSFISEMLHKRKPSSKMLQRPSTVLDRGFCFCKCFLFCILPIIYQTITRFLTSECNSTQTKPLRLLKKGIWTSSLMPFFFSP